jgi:hypothetical protein
MTTTMNALFDEIRDLLGDMGGGRGGVVVGRHVGLLRLPVLEITIADPVGLRQRGTARDLELPKFTAHPRSGM